MEIGEAATDPKTKLQARAIANDCYRFILEMSTNAGVEKIEHLYEMSGNLNSEELDLALKIDQLDNLNWWHRNMEKRDWYIQGWQHDKFYPDFIVKTKAGNYIIIEYKGENILTTEDTEYKEELGKKWALAGKKYHFVLAHKNNVDEVIKEIQKL